MKFTKGPKITISVRRPGLYRGWSPYETPYEIMRNCARCYIIRNKGAPKATGSNILGFSNLTKTQKAERMYT